VRNPLTASHRQLADALEELRLERRLSYRELGEEVGLPEPTIRKFSQHSGDRGFYETTVYPIRKYFEKLGRRAS